MGVLAAWPTVIYGLGFSPGRFAAGDLDAEPGAGVGPVAVGGGDGQAEDLGRLGQGQPGEDAELRELGLGGVLGGELLEGLVEGQQVVVGLRRGGLGGVEVDAAALAAALEPMPAPGALELSERFGVPAAMRQLLDAGEFGEDGEGFEEFCTGVLAPLNDLLGWRELTRLTGAPVVVGFTYGEDPRDFLRTVTRANPYPLVRRLWGEYWQADEFNPKIQHIR
jgi:hypothetical protein